MISGGFDLCDLHSKARELLTLKDELSVSERTRPFSVKSVQYVFRAIN